MNIEQRVAKLERSARVWRAAAVGAVALAGLLGFHATGDDGVLRGVGLVLSDPETDAELELSFEGEGDERSFGVSVWDSDRDSRLILASFGDERCYVQVPGASYGLSEGMSYLRAAGISATAGKFRFLDENGALIAKIGKQVSGANELSITGSDGGVGLLMAMFAPEEEHPGMGALILRDLSGKYEDRIIAVVPEP